MVEYATCGVLALHRDMPIYLQDQRQGRWAPRPVRRAVDRSVGIMGLGVLGVALASALAPFGFRLARLEPIAKGHRRDGDLRGRR